MGRSSDSTGKRDVKNKQTLKRKEKEKKKLEKKSAGKSGFDDMIAYVDENGMISATPPDPAKKSQIAVEDIVISPPKKTAQDEVNPDHTGKLTTFNESRGFGFIKDLVSQESFFVHVKDITGDIKEGDTVTFRIARGPKGYSAVEVKIFKKPASPPPPAE